MFFESVEEIYNFDKVKARLKSRKLRLIEEGEWEKHGPHEGQPYAVIIGPCEYLPLKQEIIVAIYPHRIYEIDCADDWWKCKTENEIPVRRKNNVRTG
jgi:hypothetical protein